MAISGSLANALSGLTAAARAAEVVSANVANALTEGYGRREVELAARSLGGTGAGVAVRGIIRSVDIQLISDRRLADADLGESAAKAGFLKELVGAIGTPDDAASLSGRIASFEAALAEAASRPDSEARLAAVLAAAGGISDKLNTASDRIQQLRMDADRDIAGQVERLNDSLTRIADLNNAIRVHAGAGNDTAALMDQRQQLIDGVSAIVPLRQVDRGHGQIALFTPGGAILLDGRAARVGFAPAGVIVPQMTQGSGALSGLTLNGQPVSTSGGPLAGGSLAGLFTLRDDLAVTAQSQLDAVARDMLERFADPAVDATIPAGGPGLFTDAGAAFAVANEIGLAGRLAINPGADPAAGGALWRLRDGLGATVPGAVGNAALLDRMAAALVTVRSPASGGFSGAARTASALSGDLISLVNGALRGAEDAQGFATARRDTLRTAELRGGVDTDHEMQRLLLIEQAYAANARVVSTVDEMLQLLMGL